jgi:hypothetical protein
MLQVMAINNCARHWLQELRPLTVLVNCRLSIETSVSPCQRWPYFP